MLKSVYQEVFGEVELYTIMETGAIFVARNKN